MTEKTTHYSLVLATETGRTHTVRISSPVLGLSADETMAAAQVMADHCGIFKGNAREGRVTNQIVRLELFETATELLDLEGEADGGGEADGAGTGA